MKKQNYNIAMLLVLFLFACGQEKKETVTAPVKDTVQKTVEAPLVQSPFEKTNVPFETLTVDADSGKIFLSANGYGTSVQVPGGVFIDSARNKIEGKIQLQYRELHTPNDMLAAGIPLNYDAAGMLKRFNTAGMVELRAYQNNQPVYLDSGKVIQVNMASFEPGQHFHAFYLDEKTTRDWEYVKDLEGKENPEKKKIIRRAMSKVTDFDLPFSGEYFATSSTCSGV